MKKKSILVAALTSCMALTATFTGCSLVSTNNKLDMEQVVATVDISKSDKFEAEGFEGYKTPDSAKTVIKRDMVSYFINVGYSYVQNGSSYEDTFNMLLDALISNSVLTQYSAMAILKEKATNTSSDIYDKDAVATYNSKTTDKEKYEYLLGGENSDGVKLAKYNLYSSLNSAIDNYEKTIIEDKTEYSGTDTRTTPTNLNTEQDNYYPKDENGELYYNVYTGYKGYLLDKSGAYKDEALDGTTRATRVKAYNTFINNLRNNNLVDGETESGNLTKILELDYIKSEYVSQLESRIINMYYEIYEEQMTDKLSANGYDYVKNAYNELIEGQRNDYKSASAFESAMSSMSSTSFILSSPSTDDSDRFDNDDKYGKFGFVYNILLPFNTKQSVKLNGLKSMLEADGKNDEYYYERNKLLKEITTEDQRAAWFNGETDYSFNANETEKYTGSYYGPSGYLFFENNLTDSEEGGRYKKLQAYYGEYSYNGSVYENEDGSYTLIGNKLTIEGMLNEFEAYIEYVLGDKNSVKFDTPKNPDYYGITEFSKADDEDEIDYSKFLYASGKVDFGSAFKPDDLFNTTTKQYAAMSAVNELQYAYTTDTGVLSNYIGYSVSAYDTNYIKEFEYAAKYAISQGAGAFAVCAGDYGWHLIYVTYTFDAGDTYNPVWTEDRISEEGTFENLFFEWIKSSVLSDVSTKVRTQIISDYNKDATVTKYQKRYQDLLDLNN